MRKEGVFLDPMTKTEPSVDKAILIRKVWQEYGLRVSGLTFLPRGEVSDKYIAAGPENRRYLLKIWGNSRMAQASVKRLDFTMALMSCLHTDGLFPYVPLPLRTRDGEFFSDIAGWWLAVFLFIEGATLEDECPSSMEINTRIATAIGRVHRSTPQVLAALGAARQYTENFDIPFAKALAAGLDTFEGISSDDRPGKRRLKELLAPHRETIFGFLERLYELQRLAQRKSRAMVLCHTDLVSNNLLLGRDGGLFILDWDGAMLAPAEHDLFLFTGRDFPAFLQRYEEECGPVVLDGDVFGFYLYRRNLEDLVDWVHRILYENTEDAQDAADLEGIREDCMDLWPFFESTIGAIKSVLDKRMRHGA